ncbi:unnamed protein product [Protopolystoma xenopodis]|uniref:Uncharacterized protein n=1 Tax=Protopolystoma xenopodis TaxID=117903 RepID=A0A448XAV8_9PLAT|nr:unnamed protein product [Protopolystoma xenopodis]
MLHGTRSLDSVEDTGGQRMYKMPEGAAKDLSLDSATPVEQSTMDVFSENRLVRPKRFIINPWVLRRKDRKPRSPTNSEADLDAKNFWNYGTSEDESDFIDSKFLLPSKTQNDPDASMSLIDREKRPFHNPFGRYHFVGYKRPYHQPFDSFVGSQRQEN